MKFRASFCDPFQKEIIEIGEIAVDKIIETFQQIHWTDFLEKIKERPDDEIFYSPSLEIENMENKNGVVISAIDNADYLEFYIFYKRFDKIKSRQHAPDEKETMITEQTYDDAVKCLNALINNDLDFLENKIQ